MKLLWGLAVWGMALCAAAHGETKFAFAATPGQLPKTVLPMHYALSLRPDAKTLTFSGHEIVQICVAAPVRSLVMNQLGLTIRKAVLQYGNVLVGKPLVKADNQTQTLTLTFAQPIVPGTYTLHMDYQGLIGQQPQGLFAIRYTTPTQKPALMFATQMEPTDARRMFPGWDEPSFRATYQLRVTVPQSFLAVSNTPVTRETKLPNGVKQVTFAVTPPMASYLVVFCAGQLEAQSGEAAGVKLRVITTQGRKAQGTYALSVMQKILPYYNAYFGVKYPLPKLDLIALPGGFSGAMENWGGMTYNQGLVLYDPQASPESAKQTIFNVVSHETAHQWSGDLVTMAWWDDLWLNEGFASWMADKATDHFNPQWHVLDRAVSDKDDTLQSDSYPTTHPLQQPVADPLQAAAAFDEITYRKGEAILRMFENYLGAAAFQAGIQKYMAANQYSNATPENLWDALGQTSGRPVAQIAAGWTEQPGFPLVMAQTSASGGIVLTQERFAADPPVPAAETWQIPVSYRSKTVLLGGLPLTLPADAGKLNAGNLGFYRVQYAPPLFRLLATRVETFSPADRIGLLGDTWALAKAGRVSAADYLDLAQEVRADTDGIVSSHLRGQLGEIARLERGQPGQAAFDAYLRVIVSARFAAVGWQAKPGESSGTASERADLIATLGRLNDLAVVAGARTRFAAYVQDPNALSADLVDAVFGIVGRCADQATYDHLSLLARTARDEGQKERFYNAMAAARDPNLAQQTLNLALSPELASTPFLRLRLVSRIAEVGEQPDLALQFFNRHQDVLLSNQDVLTRLFFVPRFYEAFTDTAHADALEAYAKAALPAEAAPQTAKAAARIRSAAALKARVLPLVDQWITLHQKASLVP